MYFISILTFLLSVAPSTFGQSRTKRYLYMSTPDGAQQEARSGSGILVFDIDDGHKFVKRIEIPIFEEGLRGNLPAHSVYYSTTNHRLGRFDLERERILWESTFEGGCCDRSSITLDGKKIYAPTGFWYEAEDAGFVVVNGEDGQLIKRIQVGPRAHNSIVSLDERFVYLDDRFRNNMTIVAPINRTECI